MIEVALDWAEMCVAVEVGCRRRIESRRQGLRERHTDEDALRVWVTEINGAAGEMAYAKALGFYWPASVNRFRGQGDVGAVEIRTARRHGFSLPIRPDAKDDAQYVLVTGVMPNFRVVGWITGGEGKQDRWLREANGDPAYFVPPAALWPINGRPVAA